jgi:hypothetical protein
MTFFSKVEEIFTIPGRGCVVVPAVPHPDLDFRLHDREPIQLHNPDGKVFDTCIIPIEMIMPADKTACRMAFLLPEGIAIADTPKRNSDLA